jgi:aminoglycoside phosphotransferase family enzyme
VAGLDARPTSLWTYSEHSAKSRAAEAGRGGTHRRQHHSRTRADDAGSGAARAAVAVKRTGTGGSEMPAEVALADKVAFLCATASYPAEKPEAVETRETHMSWVFLTEHFAYKLKKPVHHAHVDLRTLEARRRNCLTEIRLNRRLAPDVYLALEPLTFAEQRGLQLAGDGDAVEWLVMMRRLPDELMLDRALRCGGPDRRDLDRLADRLAQFYGGLAPVQLAPETRCGWYQSEITLSARELSRTEFGLDHGRIERIAGRLGEFLKARAELLRERHEAGRIVEGHGDLRPEHICLEREPVIIDCLEFSRQLRLVDPADEMAFLALECAMLGEAGAGERLQRGYETAAGDRPPERLVIWYMGFRAFLRARLLALHSREPGPRPREDWLARADCYLDVALDHTQAFA